MNSGDPPVPRIRAPKWRWSSDTTDLFVGVTAVILVLGGAVWLLIWLLSKVNFGGGWYTPLWIVATILAAAGILALFRRQLLWGIVLIVVALLVGPGGVSIFS
jgi:hypothetical protein